MAKAVLWIVSIVVGVPAAIAVFGAFMIFVFYPAKHSWNVYRMDAKNERVWQEAVARVVTVEAELGTAERVKTLKSDVICYEGYSARAWNLKAGAPTSGMATKSIGFETLQAEFPTGATLDIDLRFLCNSVFRMDINELPLKFRHNEINIVAPVLSLFCKFHNIGDTGTYALHTDAGWVGHPYIVAIEERPLRTLATRSDIGSSETPSVSSGFTRRWEGTYGRSPSYWKAEKACWTDQVGRCHEALTNFCGKTPR